MRSSRDAFKDFNKKRSQALAQPHSHPTGIDHPPTKESTSDKVRTHTEVKEITKKSTTETEPT